MGCQWSAWTDWSECTKTCGGGNVKRVREKLPGLGTCDGAAEEIKLCENDVCPLENDDNSLVMVIGGETTRCRENEHSSSIEIIGPNGLCSNRYVFTNFLYENSKYLSLHSISLYIF